jgi:hypothetical protein
MAYYPASYPTSHLTTPICEMRQFVAHCILNISTLSEENEHC